MDAHVKTVREILHSGDQFLVPFFQRHYSWRKEHWQRLLDDIVSLTEDDDTKHFLGPLVCTPFHPVPGEVTPYLLIDGQQRLMTITLALAALRDVARLAALEDLAAEIHEDLLVHRRRQGLQRLKVVPRAGKDRADYEAALDGTAPGTTESSGVLGAYSFFKRQWKTHTAEDSEAAIKLLLVATTARLSLVTITITTDRENPFEIFESLNAAGLPLEESDLIRNYVFMQIPLEQQASFHASSWEPFERLFDAQGDYQRIPPTLFYRNYLMREGTYCRNKAAYLEFKKQNEERDPEPKEQVAELRRFAKFELWLRRPATCEDPPLRAALEMIQSLDITTAHPLLIHLLDKHDQNKLGRNDLLGSIQDLASFVLRRSICGESTRGYGRLFPEAIKVIRTQPREDLSDHWLAKAWPDDVAFVPAMATFPLYKRERDKCRLLLEALELRHGHKEQINLKQLSIEHVLPQTLGEDADGDAWRKALGHDWKTAHERWLHTLGNLTLTGYNPELSNANFEEKQKAFAESKISLNRIFASASTWDGQAIYGRGIQLARVVATLWPRPPGGPAYVRVRAEDEDTETPKHPNGGEHVAGRTRRTHARSRATDTPRPHRELTEAEWINALVSTLKGLRGRAAKPVVEAAVFEDFKELFSHAYYQEIVGAGVPRWKLSLQFARNTARDHGLIKTPEEAGRGWWELTDKGWRHTG